MKTAVWCSNRPRLIPNILTDATKLEELQDPATEFHYIDPGTDILFKKHTTDSLKPFKIEPSSYDVVVLENCPINRTIGSIDIDSIYIVVSNIMLMLKNGGQVFVRSPPNNELVFGSFVKDVGYALSLPDAIGFLDYTGMNKNGKYMIYTFNKKPKASAMQGGARMRSSRKMTAHSLKRNPKP